MAWAPRMYIYFMLFYICMRACAEKQFAFSHFPTMWKCIVSLFNIFPRCLRLTKIDADSMIALMLLLVIWHKNSWTKVEKMCHFFMCWTRMSRRKFLMEDLLNNPRWLPVEEDLCTCNTYSNHLVLMKYGCRVKILIFFLAPVCVLQMVFFQITTA